MKRQPTVIINKELPLYHSVKVSKNALSGMKSSVGGFDSHALPPFDFKVLLIYLLRPLRRFLWSARGTNSFKTRRKGYKEKNLLRNETWCPSCLYGYSINVYTTIILDLYNVVYFKQLLTDLCHSIKPFNLEWEHFLHWMNWLNDLIAKSLFQPVSGLLFARTVWFQKN